MANGGAAFPALHTKRANYIYMGPFLGLLELNSEVDGDDGDADWNNGDYVNYYDYDDDYDNDDNDDDSNYDSDSSNDCNPRVQTLSIPTSVSE